jgi:hypothetical protein
VFLKKRGKNVYGHGCVSEAAPDAAREYAKIVAAVNGQSLFTKESSTADAELHQRCEL